MTVPHRSQGFGGKYLAGLGIDYLKKASVQCNGYPISHALINGFNGPPPFIPAEQPVSICPEIVKRAGPVVPDARLATCGRETVAFVPSGRRPVALAPFAICDPVALPTVGVGHPATAAIWTRDEPVIAFVISPPRLSSEAMGVVQPASCACRGSWSVRDLVDPSGFTPSVAIPAESFQSRALAVDQPASGAVSESPIMPGRGETAPCFRPSVTVVVGQPLTDEPEGIPAKSAEKETLSNVRSADARRAQICRPIGVTRTFQTVL